MPLLGPTKFGSVPFNHQDDDDDGDLGSWSVSGDEAARKKRRKKQGQQGQPKKKHTLPSLVPWYWPTLLAGVAYERRWSCRRGCWVWWTHDWADGAMARPRASRVAAPRAVATVLDASIVAEVEVEVEVVVVVVLG